MLLLRNYSFKPGWRASTIFLLAFGLFTQLGLWQLRRAAEKESLSELRESRGRDHPIRLDGSVPKDFGLLRYRRVTVIGQYDAEHQFLVDNQVHRQQAGYHVLTPLRFNNGQSAVLVNRGWVPLGEDRNARPSLRMAGTEVEISGRVDRFQAVGLKLDGAEIPSPGWPAVVGVPEPQRIGDRLGYPVLPYQVLLDSAADQGYVREWQESRLDPGKNRGYALQWFLFAAVAFIIYVRHGLRTV